MNTAFPLPRNAALAALFFAALPCPALAQGSWAFAPGAFTHNPMNGQRVVQYAAHEPVEGLPDPRQTVSRYWQTRTNLRGADGSLDTIYEVRSFGNTLGGFDAQRERGFDAQLQTLDALRPFRFNPYLFFGGLQGFGYGTPGYPAGVPGVPVPAPQGAHVSPYQAAPQQQLPQQAPCDGPGCQGAAAAAPIQPPPGQPGTAYPYAAPSTFVAPPIPFGFYGYGPGFGVPPWWGHIQGRGPVPGRGRW